MRYLKRELEEPLKEAASQFPVVLVTGPRQAGKSTLIQHCFPSYTYVSFDDLLVRELAASDPALFLKTYPSPLIIDEIQYVPHLLSAIKLHVDRHRHIHGQYILTGSQIFPLMQGVSESLAGRIAVLQLYPLSWKELPNVNPYDLQTLGKEMLQGFYPEFQSEPELNRKLWHSSYLTTYLERDIRAMRSIQDLGQFQRYLVLLAARAGQLFNLTEICKECGISQTTAKDWLNLLQATSIIYLLEPYAKNLTKRVIKSPKLLFVDTGLLSYLLRIESVEQLIHSPFAGHLFENMVIMETIKRFAGKGERAPCYFYRTSTGSEVDLILDYGESLEAYEIKFSATPTLAMAQGLKAFADAFPKTRCTLLNLREQPLPLSETVQAKHWLSDKNRL